MGSSVQGLARCSEGFRASTNGGVSRRSVVRVLLAPLSGFAHPRGRSRFAVSAGLFGTRIYVAAITAAAELSSSDRRT